MVFADAVGHGFEHHDARETLLAAEAAAAAALAASASAAAAAAAAGHWATPRAR